MKKNRYSDWEYYGFVFPSSELKTPILNHYFKSIHVNMFLHETITQPRYKLGLPVYN